jgi:hypothetical protein
MSSPLIDQFRKGGVSRDVRLTAATGMLPLKPLDQVELLLLLTRDKDEEIRGKAETSLLDIPLEDLAGVMKERATDPKVLHFFGVRVESPELLQAVVQNPTTEDQTIVEMIPRLSADLLEFIVINQMRLLRHTALVDALDANPSMNTDQKRRLNELKHDFKIGEEPEAPPVAMPEEVALVDLNKGPPEDEEPAPQTEEQVQERYGDERESEELNEEEKEEQENLLRDIPNMTPAERMKKALTGNRQARMMLVRDRNRVVYSAVLTSPKTTEGDVEAYTSMRNISPEVLRIIGGKREWTKKYSVAHELVKNPLTPIEVSMKHITRLSAMDLKRLTRDRGVPELIRRQAKKMTTPKK